MNERIRKLAKKSGFSLDSTGIYTAKLEHLPITENMEKFAELIVRECVNVALEQKKQVEEMEVYNLQDEVWNRARIQQSEHIVDKIKQHFGVEE